MKTPTPEQWVTIKSLFDEALHAEPSDREALLAGCSCEPVVIAEVKRMLTEDAAGDMASILGPDGLACMAARLVADEEMFDVGDKVGQFEILSELGRGGMGIVYRARQNFPPRDVALKVMRPEAVSPAGLRRFEQESTFLARLKHAGIAQIYGAGVVDSPSGKRPFFAMELVSGLPISDYIRRHALSIKERLELLARVCDAAHHAHQKGVIHRDLKPSNVLVDEVGQPRIIDFGVAGEIDALTLATMRTSETDLLGTLVYMSPEQLRNASGTPDTRSDVYALGVMAYEALSGHAAFDIQGSGLVAAIRAMEEQTPAALGRVDRRLRGDIETVVAKAMARDKSLRYGAASDFAADLRRCVTREAVLARPPSVIYQTRAFTRRNRALVGAMCGVLLAIGIGAGGVAWQWRETQRQIKMRDLAFGLAVDLPLTADAEARVRHRAEAHLLVPWLGGRTRLRSDMTMRLCELSADRLMRFGDAREADLMYVRAGELLEETGTSTAPRKLRIAGMHADAVRLSGDPWQAERLVRNARESETTDLSGMTIGEARPIRIQRAKLRVIEAQCWSDLGRPWLSARALREVIPELASTALEGVNPPDEQWTVLIAKITLARILVEGGPESAGEGLDLAGELWAIREMRSHKGAIWSINEFAILREMMAEAKLGFGEPAEAEELLRLALRTFRRNLRDDHPSSLRVENSLGRALVAQGRAGEGAAALRFAAEGMERQYPERWQRWVYSADLGRALAELGRTEEARERLTQARDGLFVFGESDRRYVEAVTALEALGSAAP